MVVEVIVVDVGVAVGVALVDMVVLGANVGGGEKKPIPHNTPVITDPPPTTMALNPAAATIAADVACEVPMLPLSLVAIAAKGAKYRCPVVTHRYEE